MLNSFITFICKPKASKGLGLVFLVRNKVWWHKKTWSQQNVGSFLKSWPQSFFFDIFSTTAAMQYVLVKRVWGVFFEARDGFGPKFSGPRPIWAAPAQPKLVGPRAGPNPNLFPYRWVWAKIFRPGPAQIGWALGWARPKPIPIWGLHYIRWFFLS